MRPGSDLRTAFGWHANPVRTLRAVDLSFWLPVTGVGAAALGALAGQRWARVGDRQGEERDSTPVRRLSVPLDVAQLQDVLGVLRSAAVVLDVGDTVLTATHAARSLGLVRGKDLVHAPLRELAREVRRDGVSRETQLELSRGHLGFGRLVVQTRVAVIGDDLILLLIDDQTQAQRVEEVRRDFVANVSHELKTPVGGISLLAEAVQDAREDPEAVGRFADRIRTESERLARLVQEIVDLSRLQSADSLSDPSLVLLAPVVAEAADRIATLAEARDMAVAVVADPDASVYGDAAMLVTAVANLLTNAVNYSESGTRVAVGVRQLDSIVEITVSDQGQGIPAAEQERIFERFYRVDPARSRATGGTGLGLAIVKHICANHGGEVTVWSAVGRGSTFTMRLPAAFAESAPTRSLPASLGGSASQSHTKTAVERMRTQ